MKKLAPIILCLVAASTPLVGVSVWAQTSFSSWPFFAVVSPRAHVPGIYELVIPLQVMDKARADLADLRLFDAQGREIPYALRIRRELDETREIGARLFNEATVGSTAREVSVDLDENPGEHNEVEIETTGTNFRRRVDVEGSDSGNEWRRLKTGDAVFSFESQNRAVTSKRVSYPTSRYRYLRVRVFADELTDHQVPDITGVKIIMAVREKGQLTTWGVAVPPYQLLRNQGAPASSWTIDLGARVPCDRLAVEVDDESFSRPFQIEAVDDPQNLRLVASGELTRRLGEPRQPLVITFSHEENARKLRLVITDHSNPMLSISSITASAPARQLIFELKEPSSQPLRLFFGNSKLIEPRYDFEKVLSSRLVTSPAHSDVGTVVSNPDYKPEPLPFTERLPWLIYLVLTISSIALAWILFSLARTTLRAAPQTPEESK